MVLATETSLADSINELLDVEQILQKIGYRVDTIQQVGDMVKCFCPIHHEDAFKSLIINTKRKTYKCTRKVCQAFSGGTLVHLYALHNHISDIQAGFDLIKHFEISLPPPIQNKLLEEFYKEARQFFNRRKYDDATKKIDEVLEIEPDHAHALLLKGELLEGEGREEDSLFFYRKSILALKGEGEFSQAAEVLEKKLAARDDADRETLFMLASLYEDMGDTDHALEIYRTFRKRLVEKGEDKNDSDLNLRILGLHPNDIEARKTVAESYEEEGDLISACEHYILLADSYLRAHKCSAAVEILTYLKKITSNKDELLQSHVSTRERLGEAQLAASNSEAFEREFLELGALASLKGNLNLSEQYYRRILKDSPASYRAREGLIGLLERKGEHKAASREYLELAHQIVAQEQDDTAIGVLKKAKTLDLSNPEPSKMLLDIFSKKKNKEKALEEALFLSKHYFAHGDNANAELALAQVTERFADDVSLVLTVCRQLENHGLIANALTRYEKLAHARLEKGHPDEALRICEEGLKIKDMNPALLRIKLESLIKMNQLEIVPRTALTLASMYMEKNQYTTATEILETTLTHCPASEEIILSLAEAYEHSNNREKSLKLLTDLTEQLRFEGKIEEALRITERILAFTDQNPEVRSARAEMLLQNGENDRAALEYKALIELYASRQDMESKMGALKQYVELVPESAEELKELALELIHKGEPDEGRSYYLRAISLLDETSQRETVSEEYEKLISLLHDDSNIRRQYIQFLLDINEKEAARKQMVALAEAQLLHPDGRPEAITTLKQVIEHTPHDASTLTRCAELCVLEGDRADAIAYYQKAYAVLNQQDNADASIKVLEEILQLDPEHTHTHLLLAKHFKETSRNDKALHHYFKMLPGLREEGSNDDLAAILNKMLEIDESLIEVRLELARLLEKEGDTLSAINHYCVLAGQWKQGSQPEKAKDILLKAKLLDPNHTHARETLITLLQEQNDLEGVRTEYDELGDMFLAKGDSQRAVEFFTRAQELVPDDIGLCVRLGKIYEAQGNIEAAVEQLATSVDLHQTRKEYDKAIYVLRRIKYLQPERIDIVERLAGMLEEHDKKEEALAEYLDLAWLHHSREEDKKALSIASHISGLLSPEDEAHLDLAKLQAECGNTKFALKTLSSLAHAALEKSVPARVKSACDQALALDPEAITFIEIRAEAHQRMNNTSEVLSDYHRLADIYKAKGDEKKRRECFYHILSLKDGDLETRRELVHSLIHSRKKNDAKEHLLILAQKALQQKKEETAVESLTSILEIESHHLEALRLLRDIRATHGETAEAENLTVHIADALLEKENYHEARSTLEQFLGTNPESLTLLDKLIKIISTHESPVSARSYTSHYLKQLAHTSTVGEMKNTYQEAIERDRDYIELQIEFSEYLTEHEELESALEQYKKIVRDYLKKKEIDRALYIILRAKEIAPDESDILVTVAELYLEKGETQHAFDSFVEAGETAHEQKNDLQALHCFSQAHAIDPENTHILTTLITLYQTRNEPERAVEFLKKLVAIYTRDKNVEQTEDTLLSILDIRPDDTESREQLIILYQHIGDADKAQEHIFILGDHYESKKQFEKAIELYSRLSRLVPDNRKALEHLASIYLKMGRKEEAVRIYKKLVELSEQNSEYEAQIGYLDALKDLLPADPSIPEKLGNLFEHNGDARAARQNFVAAYLLYEKQEDISKALDLIEHTLALDEKDWESWEHKFSLIQKTRSNAAASEIAFEIARRRFENNDEQEALAWCASASKEEQTNADLQVQLAVLMEEYNAISPMLGHLHRSGRYCLEHDNAHGTITITNFGLEHFSDDTQLLQLKADALRALGENENSIALLRHLHTIYFSQGEAEKAFNCASAITELDPGDIHANLAIANYYAQQGVSKDAREKYTYVARLCDEQEHHETKCDCMEEMVELFPEETPLREDLARALITVGKNVSAQNHLKTVEEQYLQQNNYEKALQIHRIRIEVAPDDVSLRKEFLILLRRAGKTEEIAEESILLSSCLEQSNASDEALEVLKQAVHLCPEHSGARERLAGILIGQKRYEEAQEHHLKVVEMALKNNDRLQATTTLEKVIRYRSENSALRKQLADLYLQEGNKGRAAEEYLKASELLLNQGAMEEARDICDTLTALTPNDTDMLQKISDLYETYAVPELAAKGWFRITQIRRFASDFEGMTRAAEKIISLQPHNIEAYDLVTESLIKEGRTEDAARYALKSADLAFEQQKPEIAIAALDKLIDADPVNEEAYKKLIRLYNLAQQKDKQIELSRKLADLYIHSNRPEDATNTLKSLLKLCPDDAKLYRQYIDTYCQFGSEKEILDDIVKLADLYIEQGEVVEGMRLLEHAVNIDHSNIAVTEHFLDFLVKNGQFTRVISEVNTFVERLCEQNEHKSAARLLSRACEYLPDDASLHLKLSELSSKTKSVGSAIQHLKKAGEIAHHNNDLETYRHTIEEILRLDPQNVDLRSEYIEWLRKNNDNERALQELTIQADIYTQRGLLDLAETTYRLMVKIDPENLEMWELLFSTHMQIGLEEDLEADYENVIQMLMNNGNIEDALKYVRRLSHIKPDDTAVKKRYIETYLQIGPEDNVVDNYIELGEYYFTEGDFEKAKKIFSHVVEIDNNNKRIRSRINEIDKILGNVSEEHPTPSPPTTTSHEARNDLSDAIDNYRNILKMNPSNTSARCKLAEIHDQIGNKKEAYREWNKASEVLLSGGDIQGAIEVCELLLKRNPDDEKVRNRMSKAVLQRDSFKAIESAISAYGTQPGDETNP